MDRLTIGIIVGLLLGGVLAPRVQAAANAILAGGSIGGVVRAIVVDGSGNLSVKVN
jgi:hypothetical protein